MGFLPASGAQTVSGTLTVAGNIVQTGLANLQNAGGVDINLAGGGLKIKQGANATAGTGTLTLGTATVATTAIQAGALVFLTDTSESGTVGVLGVTAVTAGTGFTVISSNSADTSSFSWLVINPG